MAESQNHTTPAIGSLQHHCPHHHQCHRHQYHHSHSFPNPHQCSHHHHSGYAPHGYYPPPPFFYPFTLPLTFPPISPPSNPTQNLSSSGYPANLFSPPVEPDARELEEEDEEEPIFVLTDEWREFFAKSEARRKEAMKASKKARELMIEEE